MLALSGLLFFNTTAFLAYTLIAHNHAVNKKSLSGIYSKGKNLKIATIFCFIATVVGGFCLWAINTQFDQIILHSKILTALSVLSLIGIIGTFTTLAKASTFFHNMFGGIFFLSLSCLQIAISKILLENFGWYYLLVFLIATINLGVNLVYLIYKKGQVSGAQEIVILLFSALWFPILATIKTIYYTGL